MRLLAYAELRLCAAQPATSSRDLHPLTGAHLDLSGGSYGTPDGQRSSWAADRWQDLPLGTLLRDATGRCLCQVLGAQICRMPGDDRLPMPPSPSWLVCTKCDSEALDSDVIAIAANGQRLTGPPR